MCFFGLKDLVPALSPADHCVALDMRRTPISKVAAILGIIRRGGQPFLPCTLFRGWRSLSLRLRLSLSLLRLRLSRCLSCCRLTWFGGCLTVNLRSCCRSLGLGLRLGLRLSPLALARGLCRCLATRGALVVRLVTVLAVRALSASRRDRILSSRDV
jgi:hypothetical protein